MIPAAFINCFLASAGASAALIGLLFVAVSIVPEGIVGPTAPVERRTRAVSAYVALLNAFFVSITALIPHTNIGYPAAVLGLIGLVNTLSLGRHVWDEWRQGQERLWWLRRPVTLLVGSLAIYGLQLWYAVPLLRTPRATDDVYGLSYLLLGVYTVGLTRAWELLGTKQEGITTLLGPRHESAAPAAEPAKGQGKQHTRPDDRTAPPAKGRRS